MSLIMAQETNLPKNSDQGIQYYPQNILRRRTDVQKEFIFPILRPSPEDATLINNVFNKTSGVKTSSPLGEFIQVLFYEKTYSDNLTRYIRDAENNREDRNDVGLLPSEIEFIGRQRDRLVEIWRVRSEIGEEIFGETSGKYTKDIQTSLRFVSGLETFTGLVAEIRREFPGADPQPDLQPEPDQNLAEESLATTQERLLQLANSGRDVIAATALASKDTAIALYNEVSLNKGVSRYDDTVFYQFIYANIPVGGSLRVNSVRIRDYCPPEKTDVVSRVFQRERKGPTQHIRYEINTSDRRQHKLNSHSEVESSWVGGDTITRDQSIGKRQTYATISEMVENYTDVHMGQLVRTLVVVTLFNRMAESLGIDERVIMPDKMTELFGQWEEHGDSEIFARYVAGLQKYGISLPKPEENTSEM